MQIVKPVFTTTFSAAALASELAAARHSGRTMLDGLSEMFAKGVLYDQDLMLLGFVERAQAFHIGTVDLTEAGNPLAALTLLRSFAENVAVIYWVDKHPDDYAKLHPDAAAGFPMGRVVAEAEKRIPGFKAAYASWSNAAHPVGSGAFHTLHVTNEGRFTWQSHPTFRSLSDAEEILKQLDALCVITARIIRDSVIARGSEGVRP
jgi:hypothetical protein